MTLYVDYAWQHPTPAAIKNAGYSGVIRYLSNDPSKDITTDEAKALHAAGLSVLLVWETTSARAEAGRAGGAADRVAAEQRAKALGYPTSCPIFYAVDEDAIPTVVTPYFAGINEDNHYPVGVYGSLRVVEAIVGKHYASYAWQTQAWSGTAVSDLAHLYQRVRVTHPIGGAAGGSYDEDVVLKSLPTWNPAPAPQPHVDPPTPTPVQEDKVQKIIRVKGTDPQFLTDGITRRWIEDPAEFAWLQSIGVITDVTVHDQAAAMVNRIPLVGPQPK